MRRRTLNPNSMRLELQESIDKSVLKAGDLSQDLLTVSDSDGITDGVTEDTTEEELLYLK